MKQRRVFLHWASLPSLVLVGALIVANLGWFSVMHNGDRTRLTYVILAVFMIGTYVAGRLAWRISRLQEGEGGESLSDLRSSLEHGPFLESLCERLGLLGTLFGFVMMLSGGFGGLSEGGDAAQEALRQLTSGMATAFITTLVGYVCSILLKLQYHFIEYALGRLK